MSASVHNENDDAGLDHARSRSGRGLQLVILKGICLLLLWGVLYGQLAVLADWLTYTLLRLSQAHPLGVAVEFFLFETPKVLMLLTLVVFDVGIVRSFVTPERTRRILAGKPVQRRDFRRQRRQRTLSVSTTFPTRRFPILAGNRASGRQRQQQERDGGNGVPPSNE